jgi:hypothetical protein
MYDFLQAFSSSKMPMHTTFKKINDGLDIEEHNKLATMKGFENAVNNYLKNP